MTDNIARLDENNDAFLEREGRSRAWHRLGTVVPADSKITVPAAFEQTGINLIHVSKTPIIGLHTDRAGRESLIAETGFFLLTREPTPGDPEVRVFGEPVSADYEIINPENLVEILGPLAEKWPIETVGALGLGETLFITFKSDRIAIKRGRRSDELEQYFLVTNTTDGRSAAQAAYTPVRVVCENTLMIGLREAVASVKIDHTPKANETLDMFVRLMTGLEKAQARTVEAFEALAGYNASDEEVRRVINAAYPNREPGARQSVRAELVSQITGDVSIIDTPFEMSKEEVKRLLAEHEEQENTLEAFNARQQSARAAIHDLYERERAEFPDHGGLWLGLNAVVEYCDFNIGPRSTAESVAKNSLFGGDRMQAKKRATKTAMELVGAGRR